MGEQQVDLAAKLAARRQPTSRLSRALAHGAQLAPVLGKKREDKIRLTQLRLIEHDCHGPICPAARHAHSAPAACFVAIRRRRNRAGESRGHPRANSA